MENKIFLPQDKYGQEVYNNTLGRLRDLDLMSNKYWFVFENIDRDGHSYNIYWSWLVVSDTKENAIQCVDKHEHNDDDYQKPIYEAVEMQTHYVDNGAASKHWLVFGDQVGDGETSSVRCSWLVNSYIQEDAIQYIATQLDSSIENYEAIEMIPIR